MLFLPQESSSTISQCLVSVTKLFFNCRVSIWPHPGHCQSISSSCFRIRQMIAVSPMRSVNKTNKPLYIRVVKLIRYKITGAWLCLRSVLRTGYQGKETRAEKYHSIEKTCWNSKHCSVWKPEMTSKLSRIDQWILSSEWHGLNLLPFEIKGILTVDLPLKASHGSHFCHHILIVGLLSQPLDCELRIVTMCHEHAMSIMCANWSPTIGAILGCNGKIFEVGPS